METSNQCRFLKGFKQYFSAYNKGDNIQASVKKNLLSRFDNKIREGIVYNFKYFGVAANTGVYRSIKHQFKLNLQNPTVVTEVGAD
ncbi:hypothetical protein RYX36_003729 [Vicia faba]